MGQFNSTTIDPIARPLRSGPTVVSKNQPTAAPALVTQTLAISIPRGLKVDIDVRGDELKKEDLAKIKSQFNRWIEGLEEAFE